MAALAYALTPMREHQPQHGTGSPPRCRRICRSSRQIVERLYAEPGFLGAALRSRARSRGQHILLFVDQFEELYTQVSDARERLAFTACLAGVCDDATTPLRLVLSLRSDFLDHVAEAPALMAELTHGLFFLTPPNRDGLRDALIQPAEMAGYQFEAPAMIESMLDHLEHTPGALPLLAVRGEPAVGDARPRAPAADVRELHPHRRHRRRAGQPRRRRRWPSARRASRRSCARCSCAWSPPSARARSCR